MQERVESIGAGRQIALNAGAFVRLLRRGEFRRSVFVGRGLARGMTEFLTVFLHLRQ